MPVYGYNDGKMNERRNKKYQINKIEILAKNKERRNRLISLGMCFVCGGVAPTGKKYCDKCGKTRRAATTKLKKRYVEEGKCSKCYKQKDAASIKHNMCSKCRKIACADQKKRVARRASKGVCKVCGVGQPTVNNKRCELCWCKAAAIRLYGNCQDSIGERLLDKLRAQEYKCAYSDRVLIPGKNASLDHIIPIVLGGEDYIDNLQWVDKQINRMKTDMTHSEFIDVVRVIAMKFKEE